MKKSFIAASAAVVGFALSAVPTSLWAQQAVSKGNAKTLAAAVEAQKAKRCPEAISKSKEALSSEKTQYDAYVANGILAYCYQVQGNNAELFNALQGELDSGIPTPDQQNNIVKSMYGVAFGLKNYDKAVELGQRMIRSGIAGPETHDQIAAAMVQQGKKADAIKFLSDRVAELEKEGRKPSEATLTRLRALQDETGNTDAATRTVEKLVDHYPKPDYWALLTHQLARDPKLNDRQKMQVYRLRVATGTLKLCRDFTEMADFAVNSNLAGEGQKVIEQGIAAKACKEKVELDRLMRLQAAAARFANEEHAKQAKLEADARAAKTGEPDVALGSSQFGFGEFQKSTEWLARGVGKGGLKDIADAQLTLGIAYLRAGNKAEAMKTFDSIKATDPNTQRIVRLWKLYAK